MKKIKQNREYTMLAYSCIFYIYRDDVDCINTQYTASLEDTFDTAQCFLSYYGSRRSSVDVIYIEKILFCVI